MSFRTRLTLVAAAAVAVAVALASAGAYVAVRNVLRGEVDDALKERAHDISVPGGFPTPDFRVLDRPPFDFPGAWLQAGASQIHLMETSEATIDRRQHLALRVDDLEGVLGELASAGVEAARVPYTPGAGQQAFLRDPSGNRIELNQPDRA